MKENEYLSLLGKLNIFIKEPGILYNGMDVEKLSKNEACLAHAKLHTFYPLGTKNLNKKDIEQLHSEIKKHINHREFDQLDRIK